MKTSLYIVLLLAGLFISVPAGCLWASPITIEGSALNVVANDLQILTLEGNRGFFLRVSRNGGTFTDVFGIPINYSASSWFSADFSCCVLVERLPLAKPGRLTDTHTDAGQSTTDDLAGKGIARLFLKQRRAASGLFGGPGQAWQRPSIVYTFGVSPNAADLTWRGVDGEPLQASPEPATLLLVGSGAAGLGPGGGSGAVPPSRYPI